MTEFNEQYGVFSTEDWFMNDNVENTIDTTETADLQLYTTIKIHAEEEFQPDKDVVIKGFDHLYTKGLTPKEIVFSETATGNICDALVSWVKSRNIKINTIKFDCNTRLTPKLLNVVESMVNQYIRDGVHKPSTFVFDSVAIDLESDSVKQAFKKFLQSLETLSKSKHNRPFLSIQVYLRKARNRTPFSFGDEMSKTDIWLKEIKYRGDNNQMLMCLLDLVEKNKTRIKSIHISYSEIIIPINNNSQCHTKLMEILKRATNIQELSIHEARLGPSLDNLREFFSALQQMLNICTAPISSISIRNILDPERIKPHRHETRSLERNLFQNYAKLLTRIAERIRGLLIQTNTRTGIINTDIHGEPQGNDSDVQPYMLNDIWYTIIAKEMQDQTTQSNSSFSDKIKRIQSDEAYDTLEQQLAIGTDGTPLTDELKAQLNQMKNMPLSIARANILQWINSPDANIRIYTAVSNALDARLDNHRVSTLLTKFIEERDPNMNEALRTIEWCKEILLFIYRLNMMIHWGHTNQNTNIELIRHPRRREEESKEITEFTEIMQNRGKFLIMAYYFRNFKFPMELMRKIHDCCGWIQKLDELTDKWVERKEYTWAFALILTRRETSNFFNWFEDGHRAQQTNEEEDTLLPGEEYDPLHDEW